MKYTRYEAIRDELAVEMKWTACPLISAIHCTKLSEIILQDLADQEPQRIETTPTSTTICRKKRLSSVDVYRNTIKMFDRFDYKADGSLDDRTIWWEME